MLWKHVDAQVGAEVRRARRLVLSFHVTVANYEYLVYWRLYQDGNIECEVRATGIMVTTHFAEGAQPPYGTLVDERTYAPFHQHFLVARLDLDVDGEANTVYATESEALPIGPDNPHGLALVQRNTPLRTEQEGKQDYDWSTQRAWKVVNDNVTNGLGTPVGYKLVPGACFPPMMDPDSPVMRRAEAIGHTLWVTPFHEDERWPCGEFVVQSERDRGLPVWTAQDRSIENTDVVLWYVFGVHHITRPEEWPIMSVDTVSFWLKPTGFFDRNPALDVPPAHPQCHSRGEPMTEISNFIHGKRVAAADGAHDRPDRPEHRRGVRDRAAVAPGRHRRGVPGLRARVRELARLDPVASASGRCCGSPTRSRSAPASWSTSSRENTGKPKELTASEEIPPMADQIRFFAGAARVLEGKSAGEYMAGYTSFIRREPVGVCAAVTPWNYPAMMAVWKWAPALAAGNTMVLKPSDTTPASTVWMAELMAEFLPPGVFNVVCGDRDTGAALVRPPDPADGLDHRQRRRRHRRRQDGGRRRQARAPRARRQGAGDRVRRRRRGARGREHRDRRLLQRRAGLHGGDARAGRARRCTTTSSPRSASRRATRAPARRTTARCCTAR